MLPGQAAMHTPPALHRQQEPEVLQCPATAGGLGGAKFTHALSQPCWMLEALMQAGGEICTQISMSWAVMRSLGARGWRGHPTTPQQWGGWVRGACLASASVPTPIWGWGSSCSAGPCATLILHRVQHRWWHVAVRNGFSPCPHLHALPALGAGLSSGGRAQKMEKLGKSQ